MSFEVKVWNFIEIKHLKITRVFKILIVIYTCIAQKKKPIEIL